MQKLCCVCTRQQFSASLDYFVTSSPPYLHQFSTISGGNCIKFARTFVQPNLKHFHPFGCPVYVLQALLQTRCPFPKWGEHSRIGIFLCHSPHHASSVPLVLSTQTRLISPQFHCVFNDDFNTVKKEQADTSIWKVKAHLQEAKE